MITIPTWVSQIAGSLRWITSLVESRHPFHITTAIIGPPATVRVTIINQTKDFPLHIHEVRVHFGLSHYAYHFRLVPYNSVEIIPRSQQQFHLPFVDPIVGRRELTDQWPNINADDSKPPFDNPADLFKSIARGAQRDSWLEVDFNEFTERQFLRGRLQPLFYKITQMTPR